MKISSHMPEFQTEHDPDMPMCMFSYSARILHAHKLPVYLIVVYLRQRDARIEDAYNLSIGGRALCSSDRLKCPLDL